MRIRDLWTAALLLVVVAAYFAYSRRAWIETKAWHWRHGDSVRLNAYLIPVPPDWSPLLESADMMTLHRLGPSRTAFSRATILSVSVSSWDSPKLAFWRSYEEEMLTKQGLKSVEERTFDLNGETLSCTGGNQFPDIIAKAAPKPVHLPDIKSFFCRSSGRLTVWFNADPSELNDSFALVSRIHR